MNLSVIIAAYYGFYFSALSIFVIFAPPAFKTIGFSAFEIGVLMSITPLVRFLSPFALANKPIDSSLFIKGLIGSLVLIIFAPFIIQPFWLFCAYFFIFSIFWTVGLPFIDALAMENIGKEKYGKVRLFGSIGFAACSIIFGKFALTPLNLWIWYVALYAGAVIIGVYAAKRYHATIAGTNNDSKINLLDDWRFWASTLAFQLSFGVFYSFYSIYCLDNGFSVEEVSYLWAFGVLCEIIMFWLQAPLLKKYNAKKLFIIATAVAIPRWIIVWLWPKSLALAFLAQSLHALNLALYMTVAFAILHKTYANARLAKLYFYGIGFGLGGFLGSIIGGELYGSNIFAFCLFCAIIATIIILKGDKCVVTNAVTKLK